MWLDIAYCSDCRVPWTPLWKGSLSLNRRVNVANWTIKTYIAPNLHASNNISIKFVTVPLQADIRKYPHSVISRLKSKCTTGRVCPLHVNGICRRLDMIWFALYLLFLYASARHLYEFIYIGFGRTVLIKLEIGDRRLISDISVCNCYIVITYYVHFDVCFIIIFPSFFFLL